MLIRELAAKLQAEGWEPVAKTEISVSYQKAGAKGVVTIPGNEDQLVPMSSLVALTRLTGIVF